MAKKLTVVVTGAAGQTGKIVARKIIEQSDKFDVRLVVRSEKSKAALEEKLGVTDKAHICDITGPNAEEELTKAFTGAHAVVVLTASVPKLNFMSLPGVILSKIFGGSKKPTFHFPAGSSPKAVDYEGQLTQFAAAKKAGVEHVVLVSSMAGTVPDHFLNTNMDKVVLWKRKAEQALVQSGLTYTILHPGGLLPHHGANAPAPGGEREIIVGVDDNILREAEESLKTGNTERGVFNLIPREDVATVCVDALTTEAARNRSFDLASLEPENGTVYNGDLGALLAKLEGKNADYTVLDLAALL